MTHVFISYSHDSDSHKDKVLDLSNRLRADGIDCWIDQYEPAPPEGWPRRMDRGIREADFVLMICTETYLKRLQSEEEEGKGLGVVWEGSLIYNTLYRDRTLNYKFIPILFQSTDRQCIPTILFGNSYYDLSLPRGFDHLYRHLRGELGVAMPALGQVRRVPRLINSGDLPTVEGELFGRKDELQLLDSALADPQIHIVQLVASGGTGKTKLIRSWLDDNNVQIEALMIHSFYSQGASEDKQISATPFFMQALKALGSEKTVSDFNTEEDKGEYVANLLREKRCLLVLDGLEPLQQAGHGMRGELKDRAIRKMLRCLVNNHTSLCIITTRLKVHELQGRKQVVSHDLQNLQPEDGVALLRSFGVNGRDVDILDAVEEYGRHALALHLLGNALTTYLDGDIRKRDTLTELIGDYSDEERHAFKVMQAYEHWLADTPELKLLYLLGLFDHPVEQEVLEVLWDAEIPLLTADVPRKAWQVAQRDLTHKYRMMSVHGNQQDLFDTHPLIREYFGARLKAQQGETWRQAHTVLYEYYQGLPEKLYGKYLPGMLEEMQPLFRAVAHGCKAQLYKEVLYKIYWPLLRWSEKQYLTGVLSAFADDLTLISYFFIKPWEALQEIPTKEKSYFLSAAAYNLCALGRFSDAAKAYALAESHYHPISDYKNLVIVKINLSEVHLALGNVSLAVSSAKESVNFSKKSNLFNWMIISYSQYAKALFQTGNSKEGLKALKKARYLCFRFFYAVPLIKFGRQGITYCESFFYQGRYKKTIILANRAIKIANVGNRNSDIANYQLMIGKSYLLQQSIEKAGFWINQAIPNLRKFAMQSEIVSGLLIFSLFLRNSHAFLHVMQNLQEIYEIAEPSGMLLHLTDYHLEMARLILAVEADPKQYPEATPNREQQILPFADPDEPGILTLQGHIAEAERLINATGYHRRDLELAELKQQVGLN